MKGKNIHQSSRWFAIAFAAVVAGQLVLAGCGGAGASSAPPEEFYGGVSAVEFRTMPTPRFSSVAQAIEEIKASRPDLTDNTSLSRAVFARVKEIEASNSRLPDISQMAEELWKETLANINQWAFGISLGDQAFDFADQNFACDGLKGGRDTKGDAFRHAIWNALFAKRLAQVVGVDAAIQMVGQFTALHESDEDPDGSIMDLHNNRVGLAIFRQYPQATNEQLIQLVLRHPYRQIDRGTSVSPSEPGLVFYKNAAPFDGVWTGTVTNPDSGGPWNATMYIAQCGDRVTGQYVGRRGTDYGARRFSGRVEGNTLVLNVDAPYDWEATSGMVPCTEVVVRLNAGSPTMSGPWTSANCRQGGSFSLARTGRDARAGADKRDPFAPVGGMCLAN